MATTSTMPASCKSNGSCRTLSKRTCPYSVRGGGDGRQREGQIIIHLKGKPAVHFGGVDLVMLAAFGSQSGYVRTRSEFDKLLDAAGFAVTTVVPTAASVCVIEAAPV